MNELSSISCCVSLPFLFSSCVCVFAIGPMSVDTKLERFIGKHDKANIYFRYFIEMAEEAEKRIRKSLKCQVRWQCKPNHLIVEIDFVSVVKRWSTFHQFVESMNRLEQQNFNTKLLKDAETKANLFCKRTKIKIDSITLPTWYKSFGTFQLRPDWVSGWARMSNWGWHKVETRERKESEEEREQQHSFVDSSFG